MYQKRDEAFEAWGEEAETKWGYVNSPKAELQAAFNAGWKARKEATYKAMTAPYGGTKPAPEGPDEVDGRTVDHEDFRGRRYFK
jgi:hypothetical protein